MSYNFKMFIFLLKENLFQANKKYWEKNFSILTYYSLQILIKWFISYRASLL